jgi:ubiquinone/menaquinone biosynthesis C-methylase UbiE
MGNAVHKKNIQTYYSRRAKDYDQQKRRTWKNTRGFGNEVTEEVLGALAFFKSRPLLEVGVGSGRNALPLLEKVKPWIIGLDLSREMLRLAKTKTTLFNQNLDLILADAENLPFVKETFEAILCMSTMHYFESHERILALFLETLKDKGVFVYGDLTARESDDRRFLDGMEKTLSKTHAGYCKPSEIRGLIESCGFRVSRMKTFVYEKSLRSLMEDKGEYFDVSPETFQKFIQEATEDAKKQYVLTDSGLTLFYTVIMAQKET